MGEKMIDGDLYILCGPVYEKVGKIGDVETFDNDEDGDKNHVGFESFSFTTEINELDKNALANILGFKNYNCYSRYIRRIKRSREKLRRYWLKMGY